MATGSSHRVARYLDDFHPGDVIDLGEWIVDEAEMVAYARRYDPQPFHTDPDAARDSVFGGLIASGWYTGALYMRMFVDTVLKDTVSLGSPGIEEVRWLRPVRPGDVLRGRLEVIDVTPSSRNPRRGTVRGIGSLLDRDGNVVMRLVSRSFIGRHDRSPLGG